jgi:CheY-like chemotaxis protein
MGIVEEHGGTLAVERDGRGWRRVALWLPADPAHVAPEPRSHTSFPPASRPRVLLIDDEPLVLRAVKRSLKACDVVAVPSGAAALAEIEAGRRFDAVLCDLMMPEMDGPAVYHAAVAVAPELAGRFVFCTGGVFTPGAQAFLATSTAPVVSKPATVEGLYACRSGEQLGGSPRE